MSCRHNVNSRPSHNVRAKHTATVRTRPSDKGRDEMDSNFLIQPETEVTE